MKIQLHHAAWTGKDARMSRKYRYILIFQAILTLFGTLLSAYNFTTTAATADIYGFLSALIYFIAHLTLIVYAYSVFKVQSSRYFKATIYVYTALIGIQIIQGGSFIPGYELPHVLAFLINVLNLIAFGSVIQFANHLDQTRISIAYLMLAVLLKTVAELILIFQFRDQMQIYQILMSLSVPVLGITILVAYLARNSK